MSLQDSASAEAWFELDRNGGRLAMGGAWTIAESARLDRELNALKFSSSVTEIDASKISRLDSSGAWLLLRTRRALEAAGIKVLDERDVLIQRLNQTEPGQLGKLSLRMAQAGVNIEVLYSDHNHQLVLVVDDMEKGRAVSEAWAREVRDRAYVEMRIDDK